MLYARKGKSVPLTQSNLEGLIRLLDDPDTGHVAGLVQRLSELGDSELEQVVTRAQSASEQVRRNLGMAVSRAAFARHEAAWRRIVAARNPDLESALILIGQTALPESPVNAVQRLDELAETVGRRLSGDRAFDNGLSAIALVLGEAGLRGNRESYYAPENSYLQCVLASGLGIPISLACVAILVGQRLELPVYGIGAPGHFLGFYGDPDLGIGAFFDPFGGFKRLTAGDIGLLISQYAPGPVDMGALKPASEREILFRTLQNLIGCYQAQGEVDRAQNLARWQGYLATT